MATPTMATPMEICGDDTSWYVTRPMETRDAVEDAARLHFASLRRKVFDRVGVYLGAPQADPNAGHGEAITELFALADGGSKEQQQSVVFGLVYSFVSLEWAREEVPGYFDYLCLVRTLDEHNVATRALLSAGSRYQDMKPAYRQRLLRLLGDMAAARWPKAELVLTCLQRVSSPGDLSWEGSKDLLQGVLALLVAQVSWVAADAQTAKLTLLWTLRWISALQQMQHSAEPLPHLLKVAGLISQASWTQVSQDGAVLDWALSMCSPCPELESMRNEVSTLAHARFQQKSLDHLLRPEEQEQLTFLLKAKPSQEERMLGWFLKRHLSCRGSALDVHLADIVLWLASVAGEAKLEKPGLWRALWQVAVKQGDIGQATRAFLYVTRNAGYGRSMLAWALGGSGKEGHRPQDLLRLAEATPLPPNLLKHVRAHVQTLQ